MADPGSPQSETWRLSPDLLGVLDGEGRFVDTNPAWRATLGWTAAEIRDRTFRDFLHPDDMAPSTEVFDALKRGTPVVYFENRYRCRDGSYRWLSWVAVQEGEHFYCTARDVTGVKERESSLQTYEDEALLREQLIAILGHDLRNPLAAINAAVRMASRENNGETTSNMLTAIWDSSRRMHGLIETIMDFARARLGGGIPVAMTEVHDLAERFEKVITEIRLAHPDRAIAFRYAFDGPLRCDPGRLEQVLSNLVANAITHGSSNRTIRVSVPKDRGAFVISVHNHGTPIPDAVRPRLFQAFSRTSDDNSLQGLGLGLFISDQIAKAHGGRMTMKSDTSGTEFSLVIDLDGTATRPG